MHAQTSGRIHPDHPSCRYGGARIAFRGPAKRLKGAYVTFLGGSETYGPYVAAPFPELVELQTGLTCVNLGCRNGGIDSYLSAPSLIDLCSLGAATVIEITGAQNMSNRFYTVDPRYNDRFIRASKLMKSIFYDIDFGKIRTTGQMLSTIARNAEDRIGFLKREIQTAWVARMRTLIRAIDGPTVLLWAADHAPFSSADGGTICRPPLFIDRAMLHAVMDEADHVVEAVIPPGEAAAGFDTIPPVPGDIGAAAGTLGPLAHRRIAAALKPVLSAMLDLDDSGESSNIFAMSA